MGQEHPIALSGLVRNCWGTSVLGRRRKLQEIQWAMSSQSKLQSKHLKCKLSWDYHKLPGRPPLMKPMTHRVGYTDQRQLKGCCREDSKEEGLSLAKDPSPKEEKGEGKSLGDKEIVEKNHSFHTLFPYLSTVFWASSPCMMNLQARREAFRGWWCKSMK